VTGLLLRLAGPLQSWGEHSTFADRDTLRYPTRSGITGIFAAAQGLRRGERLDRYAPLTLTVRIDRPGVLLADFHTTGGGLPRGRTVPTAEGGRRAEGKATIVTRRMYLSDAVFTVAVEGPGTLIDDLAAALRSPHWQPYLGRRSCPPTSPCCSAPPPTRSRSSSMCRCPYRCPASGPTRTARSARTSSPRNRPAPPGR
jgi:CRISPR system Cascade subunit CasD